MKYKALVSFVGKISMAQGEERDFADESVISDLLRVGYLIPVKKAEVITEVKEEVVPEVKAPAKKKSKK